MHCCQRIKNRTIKRPPPPLPAERVRWVPPFTSVGVDHTGSFAIKGEKGNKTKAYICIFVCATTRAVHLEVVENLSTTSFIMCLRRLAASKGVPSVIMSDNHRTFIAGETFLLEMQKRPSCPRSFVCKQHQVETSNSKVPLDGRTFRKTGPYDQSKFSHHHIKEVSHP